MTKARLIQASQRNGKPTSAGRRAPLPAFENAGSATRAKKNTTPASISVAAKWTARHQISGSSKPSSFGWPATGYSPTLKVKLPSILWVSADIAFHSTL